ncbi:MAG: hypothetical protein WDM77_22265 [Steroidobacteraceae bacterium]
MKSQWRIFLCLLPVFLGEAALAQQASGSAQELAGVWQGRLQVDPKTAMTVQFTFSKKPDGTYSAVLSSPDNSGISNVAVSSVHGKAVP